MEVASKLEEGAAVFCCGTLAGIIAGGLAFGGLLQGGVATMVGGIVVFGGDLAGINCFT